jgi:hypothetical protein
MERRDAARASVIVAPSVRPVAFAAVAMAVVVALALAGSGRVLLASLSRRAVIVVPGRLAVVRVPGGRAVGRVPVPRQSGRDGVPVADGPAAGRRVVLLADLSGWAVVAMSECATVRRRRGLVGAFVSRLALVVLVPVAFCRRRLDRRGRGGRRSGGGGRGGRGSGGRGSGSGGCRPRPSVRARRLRGMTPAPRGRVRGAADRVRGRVAAGGRQRADDGRRLRTISRRGRPVVRRRGCRRGHRHRCRRRSRRHGTGTRTGADSDRPEMGGEMPRARVEDQRHRGSAEHERDERRHRHTSECPDCTPSAAFIGRQRPFLPFPDGLPRPWLRDTRDPVGRQPGRVADIRCFRRNL